MVLLTFQAFAEAPDYDKMTIEQVFGSTISQILSYLIFQVPFFGFMSLNEYILDI